eukprot:COSAG06_NODE_38022_length_428_cov_0.851064_1_plen_43_part_10
MQGPDRRWRVGEDPIHRASSLQTQISAGMERKPDPRWAVLPPE